MKNHYLNSVEPSDIGLTATDDLDDIVSKIPDNTTVKLWINDKTTYGAQVRDQIGSNVYGYLYVYSTDSAINVVHFILFNYEGTGIYFKTYTDVNDYGWSSSWINLHQSVVTANRALISNSSGGITASTVTSTELGYLDGVTSNIQTQLNNKSTKTHTHTGSQVTGLTANRVLVSSSSGYITVSGISTTTLGYLSGVTSNIQTQINTVKTTANNNATKLNKVNLFGHTPNSLSVTNTTSINELVEGGKLPAGSTFEMWINDSSLIGQELKEIIDPSQDTPFFGWLFMHRTYDNETVYVFMIQYSEADRIWFNQYTTVNNKGWNKKWGKLSIAYS